MKASDLIESYVDDVARRLPRRLRNDVGFELQALLNEELQAKADAAGRPADEAMAQALLGGFGRPEDVADRYRPATFTIIKPAETRAFALTAILGVAVQWAVSLPAVFLRPETFPGQAFVRLGAWWLGSGLGAFWLPGLMVVVAIVVRWIAHRWPRSAAWSPPRPVDRDLVSRPILALGLVGWALAIVIWVGMPWYGPHLPGVLPRVFAFDDGFLHTRAPWLLPVWAGHYGVHAVALVEGRWRRITRRISLGFGLAICGLLAWFIAAGPVFINRATDDVAKGLVLLTILLSLIGAMVELHREQTRVHRPKGLAGARS